MTIKCIFPSSGAILFHSVAGSVITALIFRFLADFNSEHYNRIKSITALLTHTLFGVITCIVLTYFVVSHLRKVAVFRKIWFVISGWLLLLNSAVVIFTGMVIVYFGQSEGQSWLPRAHSVSALVFILIALVHIIGHAISSRKRTPISTQTIVGTISIYALTIAMLNWMSMHLTGMPSTADTSIADYSLDYGPNPFAPAESKTFNGDFVGQEALGDSHRCATCHEDIARQWTSSAHSQAASDPAYEKNIELLVSKKGISAARYCEGCHAPIALLSGQLTDGGKHGGIDGTIANTEGVSCRTCHRTIALEHTRGNGSYVIGSLVDSTVSKHSELSLFSDLAVRIRPTDHKLEMSNAELSTSAFCSTCHAQFMDKDMNSWGWVGMQDEYSAWASSPYSHQSSEIKHSAVQQSCQSCHMPLEEAVDPSANREGMVRSHRFPGSNTFLPLINGDQKQMDFVRHFLESNKINLTVVEPVNEEVIRDRLAIDQIAVDSSEPPFYWFLGEQNAEIMVAVTNHGVGHDFPGGTIDLGEAWIEITMVDAEGEVVFTSGALDEDNNPSDDTWYYRSLPVDRDGRLVWKHDLFNMIGESFKRTIKSGETDIARYEFKIPVWAKSPLTISGYLRFRKFNNRYLQWVTDGAVKTLPIATMAWDTLSIPLVERDSVRSN